MEKQRSIQFAIIGVLSFAVLFMSIGFATYSQVIDLNSPRRRLQSFLASLLMRIAINLVTVASSQPPSSLPIIRLISPHILRSQVIIISSQLRLPTMVTMTVS